MRLRALFISLILPLTACGDWEPSFDTPIPQAVAPVSTPAASRAPRIQARPPSQALVEIPWSFPIGGQNSTFIYTSDIARSSGAIMADPASDQESSVTPYIHMDFKSSEQKPAFTIHARRTDVQVVHNAEKKVLAFLRTDIAPNLLQGLDFTNGSPLWTQPIQIPAGEVTTRVETVDDVFVLTSRTQTAVGPTFYRGFYDVLTGELRGSQLLGEPFLSAIRGKLTPMLPMVASISTASQRWSKQSFEGADGAIFEVQHSTINHSNVSFGWKGEELIELDGHGMGFNRVAVSEDYVVLMTSGDGFAVVDAESGDVRVRVNPRPTKRMRPVFELASIDKDYVVFQSPDGVVAYSVKTGAQVGSWYVDEIQAARQEAR